MRQQSAWSPVDTQEQAGPSAPPIGHLCSAAIRTQLAVSFLALPATLLLVATLVGPAPAWLARRREGGAVTRAVVLAALAATVVAVVSLSSPHMARKQVALGDGADRLYGEPRRGRALARILDRIDTLTPPDATLLVVPEGSGLNYWLRRRNPIPYYLLLPTELRAHGEANVLASLRASPPDLIVWLERDFAPFGTGPFGADPAAGAAIGDWVRSHYRPLMGDLDGFDAEGFQAVVLQRRDQSM